MRSLGFFAGVGIVLAGCAALDSRPPEEVIRERAQAKADAMVRGDLKTAYGYLSPGSRSVATAEAWGAQHRPGFWKTAVVDKVVCGAPESCDVHMSIEYEHRGMRVKTPYRETWIKDSGIWWYLQK